MLPVSLLARETVAVVHEAAVVPWKACGPPRMQLVV